MTGASRRPRPFLLGRHDRCLLLRAQSDPEAFADFYDAYHRRVLIYLARRLPNAEIAFDLMSETFAKALANRRQFRGTTAEEEQGWLFAIARGELSHYWRRGTVEQSALAKLGIPRVSLTSAEVERVEQLADLSALRPRLVEGLAALPFDQRRAIELRVLAELDYETVAANLGVSEDVVRARVSRGLRTLGRLLGSTDVALERWA